MDYISHTATICRNVYAAVVQNLKEAMKENDERS
jgi:hypothetical protein